MSAKHEPARPPTRTDGSCSSRRVARLRNNAGRCSSRALSSALGVSITGWSGRCGDDRRLPAGTSRSKVAGCSPISPRSFRSRPRSARPASRPPRLPTSRSKWPGAGAGSPPRRSGSATSDPPGCWLHRPADLALGQATPICVWSSTRPTFPRRKTMETRSRARKARSSKLFGSPLGSSTLSDFFNKLLGNSRSPGDAAAGGEMPVRSMRRVDSVGPDARPLPVRLRFTIARHARLCRGRGWRSLPGVGCTQQPVPARALPGHRLSPELHP